MKTFALASLVLGSTGLAAAAEICGARCGSEVGFTSSNGPELSISYDGAKLLVPQQCREERCGAIEAQLTGVNQELSSLRAELGEMRQMQAGHIARLEEQHRADIEELKRTTTTTTTTTTTKKPVNMDTLPSCEARYLAGERSSGTKFITQRVSGKRKSVYCDQEQFGGGWTLVLRTTSQYSSSAFVRGVAENDDKCNTLSTAGGTCKFSDDDINAFKGPDDVNGRWRADWHGNNGPGGCYNGLHTSWQRPSYPATDCGGGHNCHHCKITEHGFSSAQCHFDIGRNIANDKYCDCTLSEGSPTAFSRDAFAGGTGHCSQWGHGGAHGIMLGYKDGHDGFFPRYGDKNMVVSGRHWSDSPEPGQLDAFLWVRSA